MLKPTKKLMKMVKHVWENKEGGTHAWYKHYNHFITVECMTDDFATNESSDYILVTLSNEVDSLGYPLDVIDFITFEGNEIK